MVKDTLSLVKNEVRDLIKDYQSMDACHEKRLDEHAEQLDAGSEEIKNVLKTLLSIEEKLSMRLQVVEESLADTNDRVQQLEQNQKLLHQRCHKSDDKVGQIEDKLTKLEEETSKSGKLG